MDIRKQLIILILVLLCAPVSAQKKETSNPQLSSSASFLRLNVLSSLN